MHVYKTDVKYLKYLVNYNNVYLILNIRSYKIEILIE